MSEDPQVTVYFGGICTHMRPRNKRDIGRTVLVNGSNGMHIFGKEVPPHTARLCIKREFIGLGLLPVHIDGLDPIKGFENTDSLAWAMNGVALEILNAVPANGNHLTYGHGWKKVPRLTAAVGGKVKLGLNRGVVRDGGAACRFDVRSGKYEAFKFRNANAVHAKLTVTVTGEPVLKVTRIWNGAVSHIPLWAGAVIRVDNIGTYSDKDSDKNVDFVLHYGVTNFTPKKEPRLEIPTNLRDATPDEEADCLPDSRELTLGCSNSTFP